MPATKSVVVALLLFVLFGVLKVHLHIIRLLLLALFGLLGLYLLYNLSQDFNRVMNSNGIRGMAGMRRPILASLIGRLFRSRRSVDGYTEFDAQNHTTADHSKLNFEQTPPTFSEILSNDPVGCARKFVCFTAAKQPKYLTKREYDVLRLLKFDYPKKPDDVKAVTVLKKAAEIGKFYGNSTVCKNMFNACHFTHRQLFNLFGYVQ